jgi:hypothetical protein
LDGPWNIHKRGKGRLETGAKGCAAITRSKNKGSVRKNPAKDRFQYLSSRQNTTLYLGDAEGYLSMMDLFKQRSLIIRLGPSQNFQFLMA